MGIFSSKTKYFVASQIYNLAGDLDDRPDYMKALTVQSALLGDNIAMRIQNGIFNGPGFNLRSFHKWANNNYREGIPTADITGDEIADLTPIQGQLPIPSGSPAGTRNEIISAVLTEANTEIWAEKYLAENHPERLNEQWGVEQPDASDLISIFFANGDVINFMPENWHYDSTYLVARYITVIPHSEGPVNFLPRSADISSAAHIRVTGYSNQGSSNLASVAMPLTRKQTTRTEYNDFRPSTETVQTTVSQSSFTPVQTIWQRDLNHGYVPGTQRMQIIRHLRRVVNQKKKINVQTRQINTYSNRTEIITVDQETMVDSFYYIDSTQNLLREEYSKDKVYIYRLGTGKPVLDALQVKTTTQGEFLPILPLRLNNKFINEEPYKSNNYPLISKAYKKAFGSKIEGMLDNLEDNDNLDDLDYAYMVFGVALNEKADVGKKYLYEFFKSLMAYQLSNRAAYRGYRQSQLTQMKTTSDHRIYNETMKGGFLTTKVSPLVYPKIKPPVKTSFILDEGLPNVSNFKIKIEWSYIHETLGIGKGKPGAKKGDVWFQVGDRGLTGILNSQKNNEPSSFINSKTSNAGKIIYLYHQVSDLTYRKLEIAGLIHKNHIYKNKWVVTEAYDSLKDAEDEESSFYLPLHYPTLKKLSNKEQNNLGTISRLLLLNSYVKKKIRWYQRSIFKIILVIAMVAISFASMGAAGLAAAPGLLGTNIAVGTTLGLAGTAAIIAGAVANMMAGMLLTALIQKGATMLFGEKIGSIVGTIASFIGMQVGINYVNTGSFNMNWANIFKADNLMKVTSAVSKGYGAYTQGRMTDLMEDYENASSEYKDELKVIEDRMNEVLGSTGWMDPMLMVEGFSTDDASFRESSDSFINRTLLTGSDIVDLSLGMISAFPRASLELPKVII